MKLLIVLISLSLSAQELPTLNSPENFSKQYVEILEQLKTDNPNEYKAVINKNNERDKEKLMTIFKYQEDINFIPSMKEADLVSEKLNSKFQVRFYGINHDKKGYQQAIIETFLIDYKQGSSALLIEKDPDLPVYDAVPIASPSIKKIIDSYDNINLSNKKRIELKRQLKVFNQQSEIGFIFDTKISCNTTVRLIQNAQKYELSIKTIDRLIESLNADSEDLIKLIYNKKLKVKIYCVDKKKFMNPNIDIRDYYFSKYRLNDVNKFMADMIQKILKSHKKITMYVGMSHTGQTYNVYNEYSPFAPAFKSKSIASYLKGIIVQEFDIYLNSGQKNRVYLDQGVYQGAGKAQKSIVFDD